MSKRTQDRGEMDRSPGDDTYSDEEATRRAKAALRRAFATPPEPRKPTGKKGESLAKPAPKKAPAGGRGRKGSKARR